MRIVTLVAAFPLLIHKTFKDYRKSYDSVILHLVGMRNSEALPNADPAMLVLFIASWHFKEGGQLREIGEQRGRRGGTHPQDIMVQVAIAIGVLQGGLRLADTAQTADGLRLR